MIPRSRSTTAFTMSPNCADAMVTSSERVSGSLTILGGGISIVSPSADSRSCFHMIAGRVKHTGSAGIAAF